MCRLFPRPSAPRGGSSAARPTLRSPSRILSWQTRRPRAILAARPPLMHDRKDAAMRVCLFEDRAVAGLEPLTLTRPACDLLCGQTTLAAKQVRSFHADFAGLLV